MKRVETMRRERKWSASRIAFELDQEGIGISRRTVTRLLAQLGPNRRQFIDPSGQNNRELRKIVAKYPGHMVHIDVKKVGRIPDGGGWRVHGRGSPQSKAVDRAKKGTHVGYMYLHSAIDGHTRLAYTEALTDEKAVTAVAFLNRARAWFSAHGIVKIERIVTDNGACYRSRVFADTLGESQHRRTKPYTPKHNGKVERYNRILAEEFLYARTWHSEQERTAAVDTWNLHYNYHRPHGAAAGQPPASLLSKGVNNVLASYTSNTEKRCAAAVSADAQGIDRRGDEDDRGAEQAQRRDIERLAAHCEQPDPGRRQTEPEGGREQGRTAEEQRAATPALPGDKNDREQNDRRDDQHGQMAAQELRTQAGPVGLPFSGRRVNVGHAPILADGERFIRHKGYGQCEHFVRPPGAGRYGALK